MIAFLKDLTIETIRDPKAAAHRLMAMNFEREALWTMLVLACVLNTLAFQITNLLFPIPEEVLRELAGRPELFLFRITPGVMFVLLASVSIGLVFLFFWGGRAMGGNAAFPTILLMVAWLQFLQVMVQVGALVLMLFLPGLAGIFDLGASLYGVWIFANFMNEAHGFGSVGKAFLMIFMTMMGAVLGISVFFAVLGLAAMGPV
ncbi:YIP1 family protein [Shimia biformata]|uniref:YIP1 family protein n=1 Tax=Shimia biformata TaxID=1294299 RepID=UPI00194F5262|nr:YIP1 family protein [Shimia biformata]